MNISQANEKGDDVKVHEALSQLLFDHQPLLDFLFGEERKLRKRPGILRDDAWRFSDEERLLIRVALEMWSGSGHVQLWELLETWKAPDWLRFNAALQKLELLPASETSRR